MQRVDMHAKLTPGAAIERLTGAPLRPQGELIDPRATFEEDYLRREVGQ